MPRNEEFDYLAEVIWEQGASIDYLFETTVRRQNGYSSSYFIRILV